MLKRSIELLAGDVFENYANYCSKDDYKVEEDGLELTVNNEVWIFMN